MFRLIMLAAVTLAFAPLVAQAQATYRCTTKEGKKYYGSTIPMQCAGLVVEQLNAQGRVVKRMDPEGEAKERAEKAAAASKNKEEEAQSKEEMRRNRALLATYTSEKDIEEARQRALADNEKAVRDVAAKIEAIKKTRAKYEKELEFYQDKKGNAKPPSITSALCITISSPRAPG